VAQRWASKYGPVFQTRLGNRVRRFHQSIHKVYPC
jgi:hypothetical protein